MAAILGEALLLMAHIDVVNVNRAEWKSDPFKLIEDKTYFHARGTTDDKRWRRYGRQPDPAAPEPSPRRDIAAAGLREETGGRTRIPWLAANHATG